MSPRTPHRRRPTRAEPGSAAACRRCRHGALRGRARSTVPSGTAPSATT